MSFNLNHTYVISPNSLNNVILLYQELYGKQLQMERKIIRKLAKKEKKKRAAVNQADGDETVSAEVKKKL